MKRFILALAVAGGVVAPASTLLAQRGLRGEPPEISPRAAAPVDFTGYWVSVVTEDWRWRMVTPARGDYDSVPLGADGRRAADMWDPKRDDTAGEQCRSYGAAAIMRNPGRIHITWESDTTLRIDTEAGTQTRLLRFQPAQPLKAQPLKDELTWQGKSAAQWALGGRRGGMLGMSRPKPSGALKVVTTHMRPGYLRKNGVPYSANAIVTEYFNTFPPEDNGDVWLVVTTIVQDPQYLTGRFITSSHFKKLPDGSAWRASACRSS